uniref:Protein kinase domain-containing protein n=1 Tax=Seriola dumerili TaxID=41447 RepID=A0A3B4UTA5_SERDU
SHTECMQFYGDNTRYLIMDFNGEGCFGKVAQCFNLIMAKMVAIKIHKESDDPTIQREVGMVKAVRACDPDKKNIVRFMENFRFNNLSCLAFEMLDRSLWDLMEERKWEPLSVSEIRPVTHQLLFAFEPLKNIGLMHTDLKPDNIMLVNHKDQPFKIKLIDFGLARPASKVKVEMIMQASAYRAPEVTLGLPLSECVVMWGVGCVVAFMYFGQHLFPGNSKLNDLERAHKYPYLTMVHLVDKVETSTYADSAIQFITVSPQQHFDGSYDDWVYEESAFMNYYCHDSNAALMTDLQTEPSTGEDSSADIFSVYDAGLEDYRAADSDTVHSHHWNSQIESYTESSSGNVADIDSSIDEDGKEPATGDSDDGESF